MKITQDYRIQNCKDFTFANDSIHEKYKRLYLQLEGSPVTLEGIYPIT